MDYGDDHGNYVMRPNQAQGPLWKSIVASHHKVLKWCYQWELVQKRRNSIANTLELCLHCTNPPIYSIQYNQPGFILSLTTNLLWKKYHPVPLQYNFSVCKLIVTLCVICVLWVMNKQCTELKNIFKSTDSPATILLIWFRQFRQIRKLENTNLVAFLIHPSFIRCIERYLKSP